MATYLLDTTVIIDVLNGKRNRRGLLRELLESNHLLACCSVSVTEIYAGMRPKEERATDEFLSSLEYFSVSFPIARLAGELQREHARKGKMLKLGDVTIAAVAIFEQLTLLTDNVKDFPMRELSFYPMPKA